MDLNITVCSHTPYVVVKADGEDDLSVFGCEEWSKVVSMLNNIDCHRRIVDMFSGHKYLNRPSTEYRDAAYVYTYKIKNEHELAAWSDIVVDANVMGLDVLNMIYSSVDSHKPKTVNRFRRALVDNMGVLHLACEWLDKEVK